MINDCYNFTQEELDASPTYPASSFVPTDQIATSKSLIEEDCRVYGLLLPGRTLDFKINSLDLIWEVHEKLQFAYQNHSGSNFASLNIFRSYLQVMVDSSGMKLDVANYFITKFSTATTNARVNKIRRRRIVGRRELNDHERCVERHENIGAPKLLVNKFEVTQMSSLTGRDQKSRRAKHVR